MNERLHVTNARFYTLTDQLHQLRDHLKREMARIDVEEEEESFVLVSGGGCSSRKFGHACSFKGLLLF